MGGSPTSTFGWGWLGDWESDTKTHIMSVSKLIYGGTSKKRYRLKLFEQIIFYSKKIFAAVLSSISVLLNIR